MKCNGFLYFIILNLLCFCVCVCFYLVYRFFSTHCRLLLHIFLLQIRIGQLQVYCLDHTLPSSRLNLKYKVDTAGLLDIKWAPYLFSETSVFASVNSIGQLQLWSTSRRSNAIVDSTQEEANKDETNVSESSSDCVELLKTAPIADCLGLSLDWSNGYVRYFFKTSVVYLTESMLLVNLFLLWTGYIV